MSDAPKASGAPKATRVKICGMTRAEDIQVAVDAGADAIGLIVDVEKDTPRELTPEAAADLAATVPPFVSVVLVTMADPERAAELAADVGADTIQFHGDHDPDAIADIDRRIIVATSPEDPPRAQKYAEVADALLADSLTEEGAGGTGEETNMAAAREMVDALRMPVVLAGGLTPSNVILAMDTVQPSAVDVASSVESEPGVKDHQALRAFIGRVRHAPEPEML